MKNSIHFFQRIATLVMTVVIFIMMTASLFANTARASNTILRHTNGFKRVQNSQSTNTWTGNTNANWNTASNWSLASVPTVNDDVIIGTSSTNPSISTTGAVCRQLSVATNATLTLVNVSLTVAGNIQNNGTITTGTNVLYLIGTTSLSGSGIFSGIVNVNSGNKTILKESNLTFKDLVVAPGNTFTNKATAVFNGNISGSGAFMNDSSCNTICYGEINCTVNSSASSNNFTYLKNGTQNIKDGVYSNLILAGNNTKTIIANTIVTGNLAVTQSANLAGGYNIYVSGNVDVNTNTVAPILNFIGANLTQQITCNVIGGNVSFADIKINKTKGNVTLQNNLNISSSVYFVTGNLDLGGNNLSLQTGAIFFGENANATTIGTSGTVTAVADIKFQNNVNIGGLGANISTGSNLGTVTVTRGHAAQMGNSSILRYYDITPSVGNSNFKNTSLQFNFNINELNGQNQNNLAIFKSTDGGINWSEMPIANTTYNPNNTSITLTGITSFSRWTVGTAISNSLPVEIASFTSQIVNNVHQLTWTTTMEQENKEFIVCASEDGINFKTIGNVKGAGTSNDLHHYSFNYLNLSNKSTYYRLTQVDFNGHYAYSNTIIQNNTTTTQTKQFEVYPNPSNGEEVYLSYANLNETKIIVSIHDTNDQLHYSEEFILNESGATKLYFIDKQKLTAGIYYITIQTSNGLIVQKLIIQ